MGDDASLLLMPLRLLCMFRKTLRDGENDAKEVVEAVWWTDLTAWVLSRKMEVRMRGERRAMAVVAHVG